MGVSSDVILSSLPQEDEITSGLIPEQKYEVKDDSSGPANRYFTAQWTGYVPISCPKSDSRVKNKKGDFFDVDVSVVSHDEIYPVSETPEAFRERSLGLSFASPYYPYDSLPGGVISEGSSEIDDGSQKNFWCSIYAWVDAQTEIRLSIHGSVQKWIFDEAGCTPSFAERDQKMNNLVKSEAVRLSNLVYNRLKGEDTTKKTRDYGELIWTLRYYLPSQFGKYPNEVLYKALVVNETGVLGPDRGITYALKDNMMWDISVFKENLTREIPSWQGSLVDEAG
ncbi:hypothetical protein, partial [Methanospirillum hungatei]|uniref:hypothetical protein n=1 Tax=Methanospirillum hungatei TaxID=2203 RepID=UPI0026EC8892